MKPSVEKLNLKFDIESLRLHLEKYVKPLPPVYNGNTFYGWSVLSSNGSYKDGWVHGSSCYKIVDGKNVFDWETSKNLNMQAEVNYDQPTEICHGYLAEVIQEISRNGFKPCRSRIACIPPNSHTNWHRDHRDGFYWVRMHIPIITNEKCKFITENDITHMPDDGSAYLVNTAQMHMAINSGTEPRYNLLMQVWDTNCVSKYFQHPQKEILSI